MRRLKIDSPFFTIDYKRLALLFLPTFLRQPVLFAFLSSMVASLSRLHNLFIQNRRHNWKRLECNGQVCYLEKLLNDELDAADRRIRIDEGDVEGDWVFAMDEGDAYQLLVGQEKAVEDRWSTVIMVYSEARLIDNTAFFEVSVPFRATETDKLNSVNSYLNEYKLISKKYNLKCISDE